MLAAALVPAGAAAATAAARQPVPAPVVQQSPAQAALAQRLLAIRPVPRVTLPVDDRDRTVIAGHVLPAVRRAQDAGRRAPQEPMNHLLMVLQPSVEQDHALTTLLDQQLDRGSSNFHRWLQPDEFGARFGVHDADIAKVTGWLTQQGFKVEQVARGKRFIQFSGTVAQVESAFRTEMHNFQLNGRARIANNSDISVPTALRPVIAGVPTLNNFFKTASFVPAGTMKAHIAPPLSDASAASRIAAAGAGEPANLGGTWPVGKIGLLDLRTTPYSWPEYTNGTTHFVGAGDFATIYNTTPLLTAGNDGTGISIGIVARTDVFLSDVQLYRTMFNLKPNDPNFIVVGEDPGVVPGDDGESDLDVEVSGGAAPGATVDFVTSRATLTTDGVDLSAMYIVQNNLTDVMSESYGQCEDNFALAQETLYANLWGQAAAQGISVFLSSGDNGPAGCDNSNSTFESFGYAVSGLASTPFNTAVGGTLFADTAANWNATATVTPPFASALGYIPEVPWNEAKASGAVGAAGLWSGSGGISAYFATPAWQHGFGVPAADPAYAGTGAFSSPATPFVPGPHRYMPDVAMAAAAQHDGTLYCGEGICQLSNTGALVDAGIVGGTSVAAPTMAGVQALIDQANGGRQGLGNYVYYTLADNQHTGGLNCAANSPTIDPNCAFHDVTTGNTLICANSACTAANKIGWTAAAGYDMATGLGSPNAANLAALWNTVTFRSTTTSLLATPTTGITHGQPVAVSGVVAPGSGTGTPTGTVTFMLSSGGLTTGIDPNTGGYLNPPPIATLDGSGSYSINLTSLPAGTYSFVARYGGDSVFAASTSLPVTVTVTQEGSTVSIAPNAFNGTTCIETAQTTFTYGNYVWTDLLVAGNSTQGIPTGTVAVTDNGNPLLTATLNANGVGHFLSGAIPTSSCVNGYTFQDVPPLIVGTHVLAASYSGDANFGSSTASPVTVTITQATVTGALATSSTNISSGTPVQLTLTVAGISGAGPGTLSPTGTVTFTDSTTATSLGTATFSPTTAVSGARAILTTSLITAAGANSIVATWPGDTNYTAITSAAVTVTVQGGTATSVAVTSNANPAALGGRPTFTATMTPTTVTSGTVNFFDGAVLLGSGTVGAAHTATFRPAATANLPAGVHQITAFYAGNATFNSSTSPAFAETFNQLATTIQLTAKVAGTYGQQFTMTGVLGTLVAATPATGSITFLDGATPIGAPQSFSTVSTAAGGFGLFQAVNKIQFTAGTHTLTATLSDPNYTAPTSNSQTVVVNKANPTLTATGGTFTYNGSPHAGSGTATGALNETLPVTFSYVGIGATTYGPTATAPTGAGTYQVTTNTVGDSNNNSGSSTAANLTINKANPTVSATGGSFAFTGSPISGMGSATGGGGETLAVALAYTGTGSTVYGPSATGPTNVGTYQVVASTVGDTNNNAGSSTPAALNITQGTTVVNATGGTFTYTGHPIAGSGTASGPGGPLTPVTLTYVGTGGTTYGPTSTAPTNAGTYTVTAHFAGDANDPAGDSTATALTINQATPTINVTGYCAAFNNAAHTATGTATGVLSESLTGLDLSGTTHTAVGTYLGDPWSFSNTNYTSENNTVDDAITDATITIPSGLAPSTSATASVPDNGAGATYTWTITNGSINSGAGTRQINFTTGPSGTTTLSVAIGTTTGCTANNSAEINLDPIAQVPTLGMWGLILLAGLLAAAGALRLRG